MAGFRSRAVGWSAGALLTLGCSSVGADAGANTAGLRNAAGTGFTPPYAFTLDDVTALEALVRIGAGPH